MKRIFYILIPALLLFSIQVIAQPVATSGTLEHQKGYKAAAVIELPYNPDVVEKAIKEDFLKKGVKEEKSKGLQAFRGMRLQPTDGEVVDGYFKVERKSRRESNVSRVYMIVGRPNENIGLRSESDAFKVEEAKSYLNQMVPSITAYNLEVEISAQDEIVKKAEKKLNNLRDDQMSMEKKIKDLEEKLAQNKRDQESQTAELQKQRAARDAMQTRRTTNP